MEQPSTSSNDRVKTFASPQVIAAILDEGELPMRVTHDLSTTVVDKEGEKLSVIENGLGKINFSESNIGSQEEAQTERQDMSVHPLQDDDHQICSRQGQEIAPAGLAHECQQDDFVKVKPTETEPKRRTRIVSRNKGPVPVRSKPKTYTEIHASKLKKKENSKWQRLEGNNTSQWRTGRDDDNRSSYNEPHCDPQERFGEQHILGTQYNVTERENYVRSQPNSFYEGQFGPNHLNSSFQNHFNPPYNYGSGRVTGDVYFHPIGQMAPLPPIQQGPGMGYGIQSAPPGVYSYVRSQPLVPNVGYIRNFENSLPVDADFANQRNRNNQQHFNMRKFGSEPQLTSNGYFQERVDQNLSKSQPKAIYKPYTLSDFKRLQKEKINSFGRSLGPNIGSNEHKEKALKNFRQREYAEIVRAQHSNMRNTWKRDAVSNKSNPSKKQAEQRRKAAIDYAKTVPKPAVVKRNKDQDSVKQVEHSQETDDEKQVTVIELLKMRHEKEKSEVALIRKELSAKIRH